ncbi:hypothetical protein Tco_0099817 [Tanacetum coccineum]
MTLLVLILFFTLLKGIGISFVSRQKTIEGDAEEIGSDWGFKLPWSRGAKLFVPNSKSGATSAKWSLAPEMSWHQNSVGVVWH